jgi:hypothetical protein
VKHKSADFSTDTICLIHASLLTIWHGLVRYSAGFVQKLFAKADCPIQADYAQMLSHSERTEYGVAAIADSIDTTARFKPKLACAITGTMENI